MRYIHSCLITIICLAIWGNARASHIYGADFFYEHISGYTYRVSLIVYGDCSGMNFPSFTGASPQVSLLNNGVSALPPFNLNLSGSGVEVTPVCAAQKNNTTCTNPQNSVPGVTRYTYSNTITLPSPQTSSNWVFRFAGNMVNSQAGRSGSILNIANAATSVMVMEAALNNLNGPNSSPGFTTIPTPFFCVNVPQQYNQGAVDPNSDSLVYSLAPGKQGGGTVTYMSGFSASAPLAVTPGSFSFVSATGQMNFTPNTTQASLVVNEVTEYRNGVIVGSASREMTFIVLASCNNTPPSSQSDTSASANTAGVIAVGPNTLNICQGTDSARISIVPNNPGGDTIFASVNGLPAGATATIQQNNTTFPTISIDWNLPSLGAGTYNFFVTYKDNGCPLSSQQTQAYTVQVIRPNIMSTTILAPTQCQHQAYVRYAFAFGLLPRIINVSQNGNVIRSYVDNSGTLSDSLAGGNYSVSISSPKMPCTDHFNLSIVDSGIYPNRPLVAPVFYCLNDKPEELTAGVDSGATLKWYSSLGLPLPLAPTPPTDSAGIFTWYVSQRVKVCESVKDSIPVYVTKRPIASINAPPSICLNDTASIFFDGSIGVGPILEYSWDWDGAGYIVGDGPGPWLAHWFSPGSKTIRLSVTENKCSSEEVQTTLVVRPTPYAGFNANNEVCQFDTLRVSYNTEPEPGQKYSWNFDGADTAFATGPGPYLSRWSTAGTKRISLTIDLAGCFDTRMQDVEVRPAPDARILNAPGPVCIGEKIYLQATGGDKYTWSPKDSLLVSADGNIYAQILKPIVYKVVVQSDYGCIDSAAIAYDRIEPCCNFSYPNAFTPNGDGRNDRFRIVTHGNHLRYELSIYNNWGQRVYYGLDADEGWDGKFKGKVCDAGTYFYYLNATCFTGHQETQSGDLMLVK